jgi:hypothetical protein
VAAGLALSANGINEWLTAPDRPTKAWLFVRGSESVRIVIDGTSMGVYGPGSKFSHSRFGEPIDATLHQAAVEHSLVLDGWTLEHFTAERRANADAVAVNFERRHPPLRLVYPRR